MSIKKAGGADILPHKSRAQAKYRELGERFSLQAVSWQDKFLFESAARDLAEILVGDLSSKYRYNIRTLIIILLAT